MQDNALRVGIDVGGTFTDLVAVDTRTGALTALKVSSTPQAPERGVLAALSQLAARLGALPSIEYLAHSTTIATNALLGQMHLELPRVALLTTSGFRDVIEIGRQNRSEVYNLFVTRPKPLVAREDRIGVRERIAHTGEILEPLRDEEIERTIAALREREVEAVAIGLLHAYANDTHERALARAVAQALPHLAVSCSSEVDPQYREYERFSTTVVNAALAPIVRRYLERLEDALRERGIAAPLYVMQSNGGMTAASRAALRPASIIESGPACGVTASAHLGRRTGYARLLSFDMGGTTAKAGTIVDGVVQVATEFEAAGTTHSGRAVKGSGYPVRFPFVDLAEVSAGGGTIAWLDAAGSLHVGPLSAGADPGPACYGRSLLPTVTDANVVLGRLNQTHLVGGSFPIDARRSREAVATLGAALELPTEAAAAGIVRLVDTQMAKVLRIVTVERGLDPRDFVMVAFGGNGPLHACALAAELGIARVAVPRHPGVFSAQGLLTAPLRVSLVRPILRDASQVEFAQVQRLFEAMEREGRRALREQGAGENSIAVVREYDARYRGQSFELSVPYGDDVAAAVAGFHRAHERRYGYAVPDERVELVNARLTASGSLAPVPEPAREPPGAQARPSAWRELWLDGAYAPAPVYQREALAEGAHVEGPALIEQYDSCTYLPPGWHAAATGSLLILDRERER